VSKETYLYALCRLRDRKSLLFDLHVKMITVPTLSNQFSTVPGY
jgi:hypothetical protein